MRFQPLVNRLLTVSLFSASCLGTLALFGAVPLLPHLTARVADILPDLAEFALDDLLPQPMSQQRRAWVSHLPNADHLSVPLPVQPIEQSAVKPNRTARSSAALLRYRLSR